MIQSVKKWCKENKHIIIITGVMIGYGFGMFKLGMVNERLNIIKAYLETEGLGNEEIR